MPDILVFGASHVGVRLAERLVALGHHVRVIDPAPASASMSWIHESSDYVVPSDVGGAKIVYVVTDEDERNIRVALAVRGKSADVPIVMALTQSRLGEKLARHLTAFAFINPPALAAERFVEALLAAPPGTVKTPRPAGSRIRWCCARCWSSGRSACWQRRTSTSPNDSGGWTPCTSWSR